jgi:Zn-dependent peptidase ImmA (M78 family)
MTYRTISKAREKGEKAAGILLERLASLSTPIPIKEIAIAEGCSVRSTPLADDLSGIAFIKDGQRYIVYNAVHHPNRQRFTIAHELGHHLMDYKMLAQSVHVDRGVLRRDSMSSGGIDEIEIAANAFAACLLMPERLIRLVLRQSIDLEDEALVGQLARKFGVSSAALTNRILNLSLG